VDIPVDDEKILSSLLVTQNGDLPPTPVYRVLASLVKPVDIKASIRSFSSAGFTGPTTWAVRLLTDRALVSAELEFDAEKYTRNLESGRRTPPRFELQAWTRPLRSVAAYSLIGIDPLSASITFEGLDKPVELPELTVDTLNPAEGQRLDGFMRHVREAIAWLA
jgi:hypothetical protein